MAIPITIPLINPNEPEALLAAVYVVDGQQVEAGDPVASIETTKSTAEVQAEGAGYIAGLVFREGQTVKAGEVLAYISEDPDWKPGPGNSQPSSPEREEPLPEGLRITQPALALARRHKLDLSRLLSGELVTEAAVRRLLEQDQTGKFSVPQVSFDASAIVIYGGGGHGKMVIDLLKSMRSYRIAGIVDDRREPGSTVMGLKLLGGKAALADLYQNGVRLAANGVGGIGNIGVRIDVFRALAEAGFAFPALVHPTAHVDESASLREGCQLFPHSYLGGEARIGFGVIVSMGVIVAHDCRIEDYAILSPGSIVAGNVTIGAGALIGMGATINLGITVGAGARVGNGATVKADVPEGGVVRAGTIWPR